jgi:putative acetyltransferase
MPDILRTHSENPDFKLLTDLLDDTLCTLYGTKKEDYEAYNRIVDLPTVVIAYIADQPVGCGCFKPINDDMVEIKRMFVRTEYREKGIASQILYELENWAGELGYSYLSLETGNKQEDAISLYQNCGYTLLTHGQTAHDFSVKMMKALP